MVRALIVIVAAVHGTAAQTDSDQELLGRIRQHVGASVAGLSNYTCQETMDRSIYSPAGQIEFRERLRLDVLVTAAGELFAWPGSTDFSIEPVENWIEAGAISTGNFEVEDAAGERLMAELAAPSRNHELAPVEAHRPDVLDLLCNAVRIAAGGGTVNEKVGSLPPVSNYVRPVRNHPDFA